VPIAGQRGFPEKLHPSVFASRPLIQVLGYQDMWQRYLSRFSVEYTEVVSSLSVDTTIAAVDIVAAGGGYAIIPERFAQTAIESGRSIAIIGDAVDIEQGHFIVGGQTPKPNAAAKRLFEDWLEQIFS
jgi:LysR family glycine cleavage system transcriptional activator